MTQYQLTGENFVIRWDGELRTSIPLIDFPGLPQNTDAVEYRAWLAAGGVPLPAELRPAAEIAAALRQALAAEYERRMQIIASGYPPSERESWPVQTGEARALLADATAATPWIDAAAAARDLDRLDLAQRIAAKDDAYRVIHGTLTGVRQAIEDAIDMAGNDVQALQAIDVTAGWQAGRARLPPCDRPAFLLLEREHCYRAYMAERQGAQLPKEYRP